MEARRVKMTRVLVLEYVVTETPTEPLDNQWDDMDSYTTETIVAEDIKVSLHTWIKQTEYKVVVDHIKAEIQ